MKGKKTRPGKSSWVEVKQGRHNRLDLFHRKTRERKIDSERSVCVGGGVPCALIVYSPLCLNCSTCVIMANSVSGNRRSLYAVFRYIMPRGEEKNKSAYEHILRACYHPHN